MKTTPNFNSYIKKSITENWDRDALTDYHGATLQYRDVARKIEKLHILFEHSNIKQGDRIALCGRNSSAWGAAFLAVLTYGAVAVPIQNEFTTEQVYNIVNHSEARLLFVGDIVSPTFDAECMPNLEGIVYIPDYSLVMSRSENLTYARNNLNAIFGKKYPKFFHSEHINYYIDSPNDLALINYTSGTTGFSKGVMLPYRALWGNLDWTFSVFGPNVPRGSNVVSILPMAHMYGLMCEFLFEFCAGNHIFFLTRLPSPSFISEACAEIKPAVLIAVPMIIEKIIRKKIFPSIQSKSIVMLMKMPVISRKIKEHIRAIVMEAFGGNVYEVMVGGAPLNQEIERFLTEIGFPITMGYGTTETGPMITFSDYKDFVSGSCGTVVPHMEAKILSPDPKNIPGEIVARGLNVMQGYFKNPEATQAVIDSDGWFHTGDLATVDETGHFFIRGRIKNMLLGSNGQNVYPEEIENKLASMTMVSECIIIQDCDKLVGLVYPDMEEAYAMGFTTEDINKIMEQNRRKLNESLPAFSRLKVIEVCHEEFKKTPKKSIKRYLYQRAV